VHDLTGGQVERREHLCVGDLAWGARPRLVDLEVSLRVRLWVFDNTQLTQEGSWIPLGPSTPRRCLTPKGRLKMVDRSHGALVWATPAGTLRLLGDNVPVGHT